VTDGTAWRGRVARAEFVRYLQVLPHPTVRAPPHQTARPRAVPLKWYLIGFTVGTLLPIVVFAALVLARLSAEERADLAGRLAQDARTLAGSLDREMAASIRALQALGESDHLDRGELLAFQDEAQRVLLTEPSWLRVHLLSPDGRQVLNTRYGLGPNLPPDLDPESLHDAVESRRPEIGNLFRMRDGQSWAFSMRVPVIRDGEVRYILSALTTPQAIAEVVSHDAMAHREWTRTVLDRRGVVAAGTRNAERILGQPVGATVLAHTRSSPEGVFRDATSEGERLYVAFSRSELSGWTSALMIPADVLDGPARRSLLAVAGVGLALLLVSGCAALVMSRRLSRAIGAAESAADALAHGGRPVPPSSSIAELAHLGRALERSAELLGARELERDQHLARAEALRVEAEAANRTKDEFLAMLGHELRNPLAPIVTALHVLELGGRPLTHEHAVIRRQVQHLARLVDDLLDVSRITRGMVELRLERLELAPIVERAVEMAAPLLEQRRHHLSVEVAAAGLAVRGDPVRLAQVVSNLITNAARYTPPGGHVSVSAAAEGGNVVLAVSDDGVGLAPDLLTRVFEPFVQGPRAADRREGGLGIGLTLVRNLVEMHGGTAQARSEGLGKGSTFTVSLPRDPQGSSPSVSGRAKDRRPTAAARPVRVLVVDDNPDAAELLTSVFSAAGHEVVMAHDGPGALTALRGFAPDVAVLDIGLPVMDGYELATRIRERLGSAAPAFVGMTGYGQPPDLARSLAAGFQHHFVKPADPEVVLAAVERLAGGGPVVPLDRAAPS
jgi:signal transduction histidine kinase/ActR/RegA family two-component response regulator